MNTSITLAQVTSDTFTTDLKELGMAYIALADNKQSVVFLKEQDGFTVELFKTNPNNLAKSKLLKTIRLVDGVDLVQAVSDMIMDYNGSELSYKISFNVLVEEHNLDDKESEYVLDYLITANRLSEIYSDDEISAVLDCYKDLTYLSEQGEFNPISGTFC
jgi:hypothetical protein